MIKDYVDSDYISQLFDDANVGIVVSDPNQEDNPLIFVNKTFQEMSGYSFEECVGQNCRFLQGPETSEATIKLIRQALKERAEINVVIKNYRKNGQSFWTDLNITPIFDKEKKVKYFLGVQKDVTKQIMKDLANKEQIRDLEIKLSKLERKLKI